MNFANPLFFLLLLPLAGLVWWREFRMNRFVAPLPFPDFRIPRLLPGTWRTRFAAVPRWAFYAGLVFAILALARPRSVMPGETSHARGIDIMITLDTSGSMRALDFNPKNRMDVALKATQSFITKRQYDRIGLLVFGGVAMLQCPLTLDYGALLDFLGQVEVGMTQTENTAIGTAIASATSHLRKSNAKSKIIVLVTDGRSNAGEVDPVTAAKAAEALGVKIYPIGVGIRGQSVIPVDTPFGKQLAPINEDLDEPTLQDIARTTGGRYFRATSPKELEQIYADIDTLEKSDVEGPKAVEYQDRYLPWLILSMVLLTAGAILPVTVWRTVP